MNFVLSKRTRGWGGLPQKYPFWMRVVDVGDADDGRVFRPMQSHGGSISDRNQGISLERVKVWTQKRYNLRSQGAKKLNEEVRFMKSEELCAIHKFYFSCA